MSRYRRRSARLRPSPARRARWSRSDSRSDRRAPTESGRRPTAAAAPAARRGTGTDRNCSCPSCRSSRRSRRWRAAPPGTSRARADRAARRPCFSNWSAGVSLIARVSASSGWYSRDTASVSRVFAARRARRRSRATGPRYSKPVLAHPVVLVEIAAALDVPLGRAEHPRDERAIDRLDDDVDAGVLVVDEQARVRLARRRQPRAREHLHRERLAHHRRIGVAVVEHQRRRPRKV